MMNGCGKSDSATVAAKLVNKAGRLAAESAERRAGAKRKVAHEARAGHRTGKACPRRWTRIRKVAKERKEKFTALFHHFHHFSVDLLEQAFFELKDNAAPGVDGLTWTDYEQTSSVILGTCSRGFIGERIGRCHPGGCTSPSRTVDSARLRRM